MSSQTWLKWRVIKQSDSSATEILLEELAGEPTVGPAGEAIDTAQSRVIDVREPNSVEIKEESVPTNGNLKLYDIVIPALANQVTTVTTSFPYNININSAFLTTTSDMQGDCFSWYTAPNTTIGGNTANISIGDTTFNVQQTVVDNVNVGFKLRLALATDPETTNESFQTVVGVDKVNNTITVDSPATMAWTAGTAAVQMTVAQLDNLKIGPPMTERFGGDKIGSSFLPANYPIVCMYDNKSPSTDKELIVYIEFLY